MQSIQCLPRRIDLVAKIAQYSHPISRVEEGNAALRRLFIVHVRASICEEMLSLSICCSSTSLSCFFAVTRQEPASSLTTLHCPGNPISSHPTSSARPHHFWLSGRLLHERARRPYHECSCRCVHLSKNQQSLVVGSSCHLPELEVHVEN